MENIERFTPLYAITISMENFRFDKEGYFHVLVSYGLFYERNGKHSFFPRVTIRCRNTHGSLGELELRRNTRPTGSSSHFNFSFSQTSTRVSITVWKHGKCFLFLNFQFVSQPFHAQ